MHTIESLEYRERSTEIPEEGCDSNKGDTGDSSGVFTGWRCGAISVWNVTGGSKACWETFSIIRVLCDQKFNQCASTDNAKKGVNMSCITVGRFNELLRFPKRQRTRGKKSQQWFQNFKPKQLGEQWPFLQYTGEKKVRGMLWRFQKSLLRHRLAVCEVTFVMVSKWRCPSRHWEMWCMKFCRWDYGFGSPSLLIRSSS